MLPGRLSRQRYETVDALMARELRPIYLLADSQLLFWKHGESRFIDPLRNAAQARSPRAAYIGASNADAPEYYGIFQAAMEGIGIHDCTMIHSSFSSREQAFLEDADIILLSGGDVAAGWKVISETGMKDVIVKRYHAGATLIGVSAGAVQLGLYGLTEGHNASGELFDTFKLCAFVVSAHDENREWSALAKTITLLQGTARGIGIPAGAGLVYHRDDSIEAVRHPSFHFSFTQGVVRCDVLRPKA